MDDIKLCEALYLFASRFAVNFQTYYHLGHSLKFAAHKMERIKTDTRFQGILETTFKMLKEVRWQYECPKEFAGKLFEVMETMGKREEYICFLNTVGEKTEILKP